MGSPIAVHLDAVYVRTDMTVAAEADRLDGLNEASLTESGDYADTNYIGGGAYKSRVQTLKDTAADLSGHFMQGDAPQGVLRSARDSGTTVYVTFVFDPSATAGNKGKRVPMVVQSYDEKLSSGGLVEFTCKLLGNGTPVAV